MQGYADAEIYRHHLALLRAPRVGAVTFNRLLDQHPNLAQLFARPTGELPESLRHYLKNPDWKAVETDLGWLAEPNHHLLVRGEAGYPSQLAEVADAPPLLFVNGPPDLLNQPQIALVGSRNPSRIGAETAHDFARELASFGLTITSGLALGIDAAGHQGALDGGGSTIAVFGTGPDRIYPASNRELAYRILDGGGVLISELPVGTPPTQSGFPRRNRIISGLSLGTLVVEAALKSGSLITARQAGEQGREVFAIPGSIHNPLARGCHRLIREGAKLVESAEDLLEELAPQLRTLLRDSSAGILPREQKELQSESPGEAGGLDPEYQQLLDCLDEGVCPVDSLVERSGLTPEAVSSMLLILELQGYVGTLPGGYTRTPKRS